MLKNLTREASKVESIKEVTKASIRIHSPSINLNIT